MATVIFYEKPGCINNTKQKQLLRAAGHEVQALSLLTERWTPEKLRLFLGNLPVNQWFNRTAPAVKAGEIIPEQLDAETALAWLIDQPLLVRRPLMQIGDRYIVGFDVQQIDAWIGLTPQNEANQTLTQVLLKQDLQTCPKHL